MSIENVVSLVSRVGMSELSAVIGDKRLDRLSELGIPMKPTTISEALFQEQGYDIFRDKKLRESVLNSLSEEQLISVYGPSDSPHTPSDLASFTWGQNSQTENFLSIFQVSLEQAFPPSEEEISYFSRTSINKPLFDYQNSIRKQLNSFLHQNEKSRIIAHMPTGSGKTRTTMELIADFIRVRDQSTPTLVVWMAHSDELCEQAVQTFNSIWSQLGSEDANIYRFWGGRSGDEIEYSSPVFIVTSFQSCHAAITSKHDARFTMMANIRSECDLLIVDEAHMSTAPTYQTAIEFLCNQQTKLVGLTATPGRHHIGASTEGTENLSRFYENNKITLGEDVLDGKAPIEFLQSRGILSKVEKYKIETGVDIELSPKESKAVAELLELPREILKNLGENAMRTSVVATHALVLALEQKKQTIVFCPTKENASDMALLLQTKGCKARAITGETPMTERRAWIEEFKQGEIQVLTNFGVLTTGFDAPNIEAVIIARPTTSVVLYSQMIGRGLRGDAVGGSAFCTLVDVVDNISNLPEVPQAFIFFDEFFGD